ncbi:MAG: sigma-54-dependent Fis family transcriptional regulator [Lentisphaerae bacterium]|nr:sigma-54-dependent Fis family transcriptional regulator [Lentisphaerota bacterium]
MHAIVDIYCRSNDEFAAIIPTSTRENPLSQALLLLDDAIRGRRSPAPGLAAARRVDPAGQDADLCILFLSTWADVSLVASRATSDASLAQPAALLHQARALLSDHAPPSVRVAPDVVEAHILAANGNHKKREEILRAALRSLEAGLPRRAVVVLELANLLAFAGRLDEVADELTLPELEQVSPRPAVTLPMLRFINAVETGRLSPAETYGASLPALPSAPVQAGLHDRYRCLARVMEEAHDAPLRESRSASTELPDWALSLRCLLAQRPHQALRWARLCEKRGPSSVIGNDSISFNLIRAELAEGHATAAARLMNLRRDRGNIHYFDDFFRTRLDLLEARPAAAATRFARFLQHVQSHDAQGRLDFELQLATEMPRDALVKLVRASEATRLAETQSAVSAAASSAAEKGNAHDDEPGTRALLGASPALQGIRERISRMASLDVPVLITGETGTGKELVGRALHESGSRAEEPFIVVNCGAIAESILESELFGHEKGAFTGASGRHKGFFEEAETGSLLLDEIGEITPRLQVALLRVLETNEIRPVGSSRVRAVHCRVILSTNADLGALVEQGRFRKDLLFRLRRLEIDIPPLRERRDDILPLARHFLNTGRPEGISARLSDSLASAMVSYAWPGNVRELRNAIERMRLMNSDKLNYDIRDLEFDQPVALPAPRPGKRSSKRNSSTGKAIRLHPGDRRTGATLLPGRSRIRRLATLRDLFARHRELTRSEVAATLGISPNTATRDLQSLRDEGVIERISPSSSPRSVYFRATD